MADANGSDVERVEAERYDPELRQGAIIAAEHRVRYRWAALAAGGKAVLDVASGAGYGSAILSEAGATHVTGVDLDAAAVAGASSGYRDRDIEFIEGDVRELPFDDRSFDLAVCFETIEHIEDPDRALDELRRVLRDDGHLLLSTPNRLVYPPTNPHHVHEYVPEELQDALASRFEEVELWRQQTWFASMLLDDAAAGSGADAEIDATIRSTTRLEPGEELYTIAVAGAGSLAQLAGQGMLCETLDIKGLVIGEIEADMKMQGVWNLANERERQLRLAHEAIAGLEENVAHQRELIAGIQASLSWRLTKPLRAGKLLAKRRR